MAASNEFSVAFVLRAPGARGSSRLDQTLSQDPTRSVECFGC